MKKILIYALLILCATAETFAQTRPAAPTYRGRLATNPPSCNQTGQFYINSSTGLPVYCTAVGTPGTWTPVGAGGGGTVTGTGTANTVSKWTGTSSQGDSNITDNATTVSVNAPTLTGAAADSAVVINQTLSTTGAPDLLQVNLTDTTSSGNTNLINLKTGGTSIFRVNKSGAVSTSANGNFGNYVQAAAYLQAGTSSYFGFGNARSRIYSSADGAIEFRNNANSANSDISAATGNFASLASTGNVSAGGSSLIGWATRSRMYSSVNGSIEFRNNANSADSNIAAAKITSSDEIELTGNDKGIYLRSANGTRYKITVSNAGALVVTAAP